MDTLREDVHMKLNHILRDLKDFQKTIIHLRREEKKVREERLSRWLLLEKRGSSPK